MNPSQSMLFVTYTPRADSAARGYDEWLRTTGNPFINSLPGVAHCSTWKVTERIAGDIPFAYFSTVFLEEGASYEETLRGSEAFTTFADEWIAEWAVDPAAGPSPINYQVVTAGVIAETAEGARRTPV